MLRITRGWDETMRQQLRHVLDQGVPFGMVAATARQRASGLIARLVTATLASLIFSLLGVLADRHAIALWLCAVLVSQLADAAAWRHLRKRKPRPVRRAAFVGACLSLFQASVVYSWLAVLMWRSDPNVGWVIATIWLLGSMQHVVTFLHHVRIFLVAAIAPHVLARE